MANIVTLEEAKAFCRVLSTDEDAIFETLIAAATDAVAEYADAWDGEGEAPARLRLAVLARVAESFDNREQVPQAKGERILIQPLRVLDL